MENTITLNGTNFTSPATVTVGGTGGIPATVLSSTQLTFVAPAEPANNYGVSVTTVDGTSNSPILTYTSVTPTIGQAGDLVNVNNFLYPYTFEDVNSVIFGNTTFYKPNISAIGNTSLSLIAPSGTGTVNVTVRFYDGTVPYPWIVSQVIPNVFTYQSTPTITNFSIPTKTYGNTPFTIAQPTSNSSGSFSYTSSNLSVATISGNIITIVGAGSSTITATQSETVNYTSGTITTTFQVNQSTPTNQVIINNSNELLYFMNTSSSYASITNNLEINYDLISSSYKVLTGNNIKLTKSNN